MSEVFNGALKKAFMNRIANKKTLYYVYYAGHGACDNDTFIILNGKSIMFPLEKILRVISKMKETYVVALLDCCREKLNQSEWRG